MRKLLLGLLLAALPFVASAQTANEVVNGYRTITGCPSVATTPCFMQFGAGAVATAQVSVGTTATLIVAARAGRGSVTIVNGGTTDVFVGTSGVTTSTGVLLPGTKGAAFTIQGGAALYGIVATGTQTVSAIETF